jgi:UDP-N-acetylglucosamine 2-epimerase
MTKEYALVTLHRPENVDSPLRLRGIYKALHRITKKLAIVFPLHPRTRARLEALGLDDSMFWAPQGYVKILSLIKDAKCVITDSGGIQKEAFWLRTPCITMRRTTEWPETLVNDSNRLLYEINQLSSTVFAISHDETLQDSLKTIDPTRPFGRGDAAKEIIKIVRHLW